MLNGNCHCGAVRFELSESPAFLVDCNCSICRRLGALWGHVPIDSVRVTAESDATRAYVQGSKTLAVHSCTTCGCTTHWESLQPDGKKMAVNFRMCNSEDINQFQVRKLDGADTWKYIE